MHDEGTLQLFRFDQANTSLEERDELALSDDDIRAVLPELRSQLGGEWAVLSTCHRTEFYHFGDPIEWADLRPLVGELNEDDGSELPDPERMERSSAARHLFRVAASLESVALGENEILGQVHDAHDLLLERSDGSPVLDQLFRFAVRCGKDVRTDTALCEGAVSVSSVAVDLAEKIFGSFDGRTVVLVGAGETAETAAEHFAEAGATDFRVVNRSRSSGERLAGRYGGDYRPLDELDEVLQSADVGLVAVGADEPVVEADLAQRVVRARRQEPLFLIDVSNPRNVAPAAGDLPGVYLYDMDDLESVVEDNLQARRAEIPAAEAVVDDFVDQWESWRQQLQVDPTISTLARYFEDVRQQELARHEGDISEDEMDRLERFSKGLVKKLLHFPITNLRSAVEDNSLSQEQLQTVWSLYNLREFEENSDE
ncbi:MAG: glutamyl-tRNA reductase [Bradymonadaceae bacterium]